MLNKHFNKTIAHYKQCRKDGFNAVISYINGRHGRRSIRSISDENIFPILQKTKEAFAVSIHNKAFAGSISNNEDYFIETIKDCILKGDTTSSTDKKYIKALIFAIQENALTDNEAISVIFQYLIDHIPETPPKAINSIEDVPAFKILDAMIFRNLTYKDSELPKADLTNKYFDAFLKSELLKGDFFTDGLYFLLDQVNALLENKTPYDKKILSEILKLIVDHNQQNQNDTASENNQDTSINIYKNLLESIKLKLDDKNDMEQINEVLKALEEPEEPAEPEANNWPSNVVPLFPNQG